MLYIKKVVLLPAYNKAKKLRYAYIIYSNKTTEDIYYVYDLKLAISKAAFKSMFVCKDREIAFLLLLVDDVWLDISHCTLITDIPFWQYKTIENRSIESCDGKRLLLECLNYYLSYTPVSWSEVNITNRRAKEVIRFIELLQLT